MPPGAAYPLSGNNGRYPVARFLAGDTSRLRVSLHYGTCGSNRPRIPKLVFYLQVTQYNWTVALLGVLLSAALLGAQPPALPFRSVDGLVSPRMQALREALAKTDRSKTLAAF
jgi:hypothetical protein